jgi:2,3-bisphosphoglycerate-dependent phosphoglycerate mutase
MTRLLLVRHGQTQWNREGRWQGQADPPLNALGQRQARRAAVELGRAHLDHLYSSDLRRAMETAQIIGAALGLAVIPDARLREINLGRWQGMLSTDIQTVYPEEYRRWHTSPLAARPPEGEDVQALAGRVLEGVSEIALRHPGQCVGVVAHELPIAVVLAHVSGIDLARLRELIPATGTWHEVYWGNVGER